MTGQNWILPSMKIGLMTQRLTNTRKTTRVTGPGNLPAIPNRVLESLTGYTRIADRPAGLATG